MAPRKQGTGSDIAALEQEHRLLLRAAKVRRAREHLIDFGQIVSPDYSDPDDARLSSYDVRPFHRSIAAALERVERSEMLRLLITVPPQHGKTTLSSRLLPAWTLGRSPNRRVIAATYNEEWAANIGRDVRSIVQSPAYAQVFPEVELRRGGASASHIETTRHGALVFVGRGGAITGRGGDILIGDDLLKDREEANSPTTRRLVWEWFTDVFLTRRQSDFTAVVLLFTRWHHDDVGGRLTDPMNPCYRESEAARWKVINLPALAEEGDPLGRAPGEPLWPEKFGREGLEAMRGLNPRSFAALYQQRPTLEDGDLFRRESVVPYRPDELPKRLRMYAASDHAVATGQMNDRTCMGCVGVDANDDLWILPDLFWTRAPTDVAVEAMLDLADRHKPLIWWAGADHISKSIGPFLRKRMQERKVWINVSELSERGDKGAKAQAIIGRMAQRKVHFPAYAPWFEEAMAELLRFPSGTHDDFVDFLANVGRGLSRQVRASIDTANDNEPRVGTIGWLLKSSRRRRDANARRLRGM